jgi:hypothetical protein
MKDRFCTLSSAGGWRDFMYNFFLLDDPSQHICELQVSHHQLLTARKGECARSSRVLLLLLMFAAVTNTYTAYQHLHRYALLVLLLLFLLLCRQPYLAM